MEQYVSSYLGDEKIFTLERYHNTYVVSGFDIYILM